MIPEYPAFIEKVPRVTEVFHPQLKVLVPSNVILSPVAGTPAGDQLAAMPE
jgi:hypothetical protein